MNILLFGLIGAGKSSIGINLAKELGYEFVEVDPLVLERTGFSKVSEVYETRVSLWKESEVEIYKSLSNETNKVIACSGSVIENQLNLQYYFENSKKHLFVYLSATPETLAKRVVLSQKDKSSKDVKVIQANIEKIFEKRDFLYRMYADVVIETDKMQLEDIVAKIVVLNSVA